MLASEKHLYEFGPFQLNLKSGMLLRNGVYIALTPKAFETLAVLVESNGQIVNKDELLRLVWSGTCVEEATLAKTVSILRKALGEEEGHHYIDTVPKRGYRFAVEVRMVDDAAQQNPAEILAAPIPLQPVVQEASAARPSPPDSRWRWAVLVLAVLTAAAMCFAFLRDRNPTAAAPGKAIPLTSFPGRQNEVAFSRDGNQIAFTWEAPQGGSSHIYVKVIGSEAMLQLTHDAGSDSRPA